MFNFGYTYPIGIDIDSHNIFAVQLKDTGDGLAIRGLAHAEYEGSVEKASETDGGVVSQLKAITRNRAFRSKRVVVHLPSQYTLAFPINFRVGDEENVEEAILRKSEKHLPFPVEEAMIDYPSLASLASGEAEEYKATIIATQRDYIEQSLLMLKQAGLTVEAVDADISSLMRLHRYLHKVHAYSIMLCHIGYTQTLISIVTKDRILVHRNIAWGIRILLAKLQENLEISRHQARAILRDYGLLHKAEKDLNGDQGLKEDDVTRESLVRTIFQIMTPYLEALVYEFHNLIGYVISEEPDAAVQELCVYGQANFIRDLDRYLEKTLNIPTRSVNPMTEIALPEDNMLSDMSDGASFGLALGLAMRKVTWL